MEEIFEEREGESDTPHRHDYYTIVFTLHAAGKHIIDFQEYQLDKHQVYFVSPGQVHQVIEHEKSYGYAIVFSPEFLIRSAIPESFIEDVNLFNEFGNSPPLPLNDAEVKNATQLAEEMIRIYSSDQKFKEQALGSYLKLFLIQCNNLCTLSFDNPQQQEAGNAILREFKQLVDENHFRWHHASRYSEALSVTSDHLNRVVKSLTGKTSKEYIQGRIILAAKRMLYFTGKSAKEVGYELGFTEPANFSAFFKNCTGKSPSEFRKRG